jgi:hypothetical protein
MPTLQAPLARRAESAGLGGFGTAEPMVSATFRDSRRGRGPSAGGRSVTASLMPTVPISSRFGELAADPGQCPGEHCPGHRSRSAGLPREGARTAPGATGDACPAPPFTLSPENAVSAARPWPSVKQPTVCTDRHNCAHRPS